MIGRKRTQFDLKRIGKMDGALKFYLVEQMKGPCGLNRRGEETIRTCHENLVSFITKLGNRKIWLEKNTVVCLIYKVGRPDLILFN